MSRFKWVPAVLALASCTAASTPEPTALTPTEAQQIVDSVRSMMREYAASFGKETCANQDSVLKFFDWSGPGVIDATATEVKEYPGDAWPRLIRDAACSRETEKAGIDTLFVRVLTRDIAVVNWTYHAEYVQAKGPSKFARGAAMQVFRRTPDGWKTSIGMSTHEPVSAK